MVGITVFHGPAHVIVFQSALMIALAGNLVGLPMREAFCHDGAFYRPWFSLADDVYETGIDMEVTTPFGTGWMVRLSDCAGVAFYYERRPLLPVPERVTEPVLRVPAL